MKKDDYKQGSREDEYKGYPLLILNPLNDPTRQFKFGVAKARLILDKFQDIRDFVNKYDDDNQPQTKPDPKPDPKPVTRTNVQEEEF